MAKKRLYKIGDACREVDIQPYVLRYWETEFPFLKPTKGRGGPRTFSEDELDLLRRIKVLLYEEGYTIAGAKKKLESELEAGGPQVHDAPAVAAPTDVPDAAITERVHALESGIRTALTHTRELLERL